MAPNQITDCHSNLYSLTPVPPRWGHTLERGFQTTGRVPFQFQEINLVDSCQNSKQNKTTTKEAKTNH